MSSIDIFLKTLFTAYFSNSNCVILITDELSYFNFQPKIPMLCLNLRQFQKFEILFNYIGCQAFILDVNYPLSIFQYIEREIQLHPDRFNKRKYVVMPRENQKENSFDVFASKEVFYISDLIVISKETIIDNNKNNSFWNTIIQEIFTIWTHKYVGKTESNTAFILDKWFSKNKSFLFNNNLFPDKLTDQEGRVLKAAVFSYEPYVIVEPKDNDTYLYMGSEMVTLVTFAKHHNMTIMPVINEFDYWGEIWENWSGNGLMGNLVEDNADIGAGALYTWEFAYNYLDLSKPTIRTGITCLVPSPNLAAGWLTPLYVYTPQMWIAVIGTFIMSLLTLYLLGTLQISKEQQIYQGGSNLKAKVFGNALISVAKPFVMQNVTNKEITKGFLGRYLMGLVFMTTLVLSTTYDSGLATIMTIPRYDDPINTVEELIESGLRWGGTQDAWIMSIENSKEPDQIKLVSRFVATSEKNLRQFSLSGKFAFSVERLPKDNYAVGTYIQEDVIQNFHLMTHDLYWEMCVFMMRKNSILLPYVDIFVLRVFEAGLIYVWQNEAATQYMNQYVQKAVKYFLNHQKRTGIVKLKMTHVQGAFGILAFGNGIALVVFLIELLYYRLFENVVLRSSSDR